MFKYYSAFFAALATEKHNLASDTIRAHLLSTALDPADDTWSDVSADELSTSGGYTSGGIALTVVSASYTNGAYRVVLSAPEWTGSGGGFTFRSLVLRNDTSPADELIGGIDFGRNVTIASGESTKTLGYTNFDQVDGIIIFGGGAQVIT
jgi:hypothetical protein